MRSASKTSPRGMFWFSVRRMATTRSTGRFSAVIFSRDRSTRIWRRRPPSTDTAATPATRSRRGDRSFCASSRSVTGSKLPSTPMPMMGMEVESNLKMVGGSASSGRRPRTRSMRVRTSSAASLRSVPQVKLRRTLALPSPDVELIWSRPATALTACSMGRVTSSSISRGPTPV